MELSKAEQDLHKGMVQWLVRDLEKKKFINIRVDLPGYVAPGKLENSVPDIVAQDEGGRFIICEVETCDTVNTEHAKGQLLDFTTYRAKVVLFVPESCKPLAVSTVRDWRFEGKVEIWHMPGS